MRAVVALLLVSACAPAPEQNTETVPAAVLNGDADKGGVFDDCSSRRLGEDGYDINCATYGLEVEHSEKKSYEEALDSFVQSRIYGGNSDDETETTVQAYSLSVGGASYPGRKYRRRSRVTAESGDVGYVVVAENPAGAIIALSCTSRELTGREIDLEGKCRKAMVEVIRYGVPKHPGQSLPARPSGGP